MKKILLLGSGELGKEFVISAQRKYSVYHCLRLVCRSACHASGR